MLIKLKNKREIDFDFTFTKGTGPNPTIHIMTRETELSVFSNIGTRPMKSPIPYPGFVRSSFTKNEIMNKTRIVILICLLRYKFGILHDLGNVPGMLQQL